MNWKVQNLSEKGEHKLAMTAYEIGSGKYKRKDFRLMGGFGTIVFSMGEYYCHLDVKDLVADALKSIERKKKRKVN